MLHHIDHSPDDLLPIGARLQESLDQVHTGIVLQVVPVEDYFLGVQLAGHLVVCYAVGLVGGPPFHHS